MWVHAFIVKRSVKVIAAGVEAGGQLDQVTCPGVAGSWKTGQGHQLLGKAGQEVLVQAAFICQSRNRPNKLLFFFKLMKLKISAGIKMTTMRCLCWAAHPLTQRNQATNIFWLLVTSWYRAQLRNEVGKWKKKSAETPEVLDIDIYEKGHKRS